MKNRILMLVVIGFAVLQACSAKDDGPAGLDSKEAANGSEIAAQEAVDTGTDLATILAEQPDEVTARYLYRHPQETLAFFEIEPGMTVLETLPGRGWYSQVLLPYLGADGHLIGANYAQEMWPMFGFFNDEFIDSMKTWVVDWPASAEDWRDENSATVSAFILGSMPDAVRGTADRALIVRTLHNLARFEGDGGFLTTAIAETYAALKPGGIAGVVQHEARADKSDEWANGSRGYLKKSFVIEQMENAGFEFVGELAINQNANDQPGEADVVWRLPPTLNGSADDPELRAEMEAIGESNRMTLKFRKPE